MPRRTVLAPLAALAILAGTSAAMASSTTWFSIVGTANSRGLLGSPNNAVTTVPIPSIAPGHGSSWNYLSVSGSLTKVASNTYAAEACIEVTLPSGDKFVIKPFDTGAFSGTIPIPADANIASPYSMFSNGGVCTLRFFELYADSTTGPDSVWNNITITLHDNQDAYPFSALPVLSQIEPDYDLDGNWLAKGITLSGDFNFFNDRVVNAYRFRGYGTATCGWNTNTSASPLSYVTYTVTADKADGTGPVSWTLNPFTAYAASTSSFDISGDTPAPVLIGPSHPWHYALNETNAPVAVFGTRIASVWLSMQPLTGDAPAATDLGVIRGKPSLGPAVTTPVESQSFFTLAHEVHWYTFTTEHDCSNATGYWFDIHTRNVAGSPVVDQELGVYSPTGQRLASDDDGGSFTQSMLTFGQTSPVRAPIDPAGGPFPRDGHSGALPAGLHYLAVPQFPSTFADTGWYINVTGALGGAMAFDIRTNLPAAPCGPADVGGQGGVVGADGVLDNNDFVVFIDRFFAHAASADVGSQGGVAGADGEWNNNDFVVFINQFFAGCP
jgi:hypothetical protein